MVKNTACIILFGISALYAVPGSAQGYPAKPVRIIVGFTAGSTTDLIGRVLAAKKPPTCASVTPEWVSIPRHPRPSGRRRLSGVRPTSMPRS